MPDKIPIIPMNVIGRLCHDRTTTSWLGTRPGILIVPTSLPQSGNPQAKSGNPKAKAANPTTINETGIILLFISYPKTLIRIHCG